MKMNRIFKSQLHYWTHMLDEAFPDEAMLVEGKHWPEDYVKAAINKLKATGKYNGSKTDADVKVIADRYKPKFHTNSALGYFNSVVRWYSEDPSGFIKPKRSDGTQPEDNLESALIYLKQFLNTQDLVQKDGEKVKQSIDFKDFSSMMKKVSDEERARADNIKFKIKDNGYKIIPFMSYEDLHEKFGGDKTGYKGESKWCHTNGQSTYNSWTDNYTKFFFVIAKDNWEEIKPHSKPKEDDNAYDEYGLSLMAILVSREGDLLRCTLRWNHIIDPKYTKPGREVDGAFISYAELSQVTGLDVETEVDRQLAEILEKIQKIPEGKKIYEGPEGICFARDHLYWYDQYFNEIDLPEEVEGNFDCSNTNITSFEGRPKIIRGFFSCLGTNITSLEGCPEIVGGSFYCSYTKITSLEGCPKIVNGNFDCSYTKITSLKGAPRVVGENFNCTSTKLTSLEGSPREVGGNFWCLVTNIDSLKGAPTKIGSFEYSRFPNSISAQQLDAYRDWLKTNPSENYPG